ncbi:uncharacterized protein [Fopius arisanus]|uniref:Uncharacterized protein n=1 Tax=Fopius arisanus TaxID=64838 RepID=A0A9R1U5Y2_9HYME|nr:PREDICTED: uncharacterized protein LOC105270752 [Fopius arisanus]
MVKPKDGRGALGHREWLRELADCDRIISDEEVEAFGQIPGDGTVNSEDEADEELEAERLRLNDILGLPTDTYSLTRIKITLPDSTNYGVRSGITHMKMKIFSPFSRGLQGGAIGIAALATSGLRKPRLWTESLMDQIIEDGDAYFCDSYRDIKTPNRRNLTVLQLKKSLIIQRSHKALVNIDEAAYTGTFRSIKPTEMHLVKALELFFRSYDAAVLISPGLSIAIWREGKGFNIFDGQPRDRNLKPDDNGSAKLITLNDLNGVFFIILEKSNVKNEYFVLYPIGVRGIVRLSEDEDEGGGQEPPQRRPSGYIIQGTFRALVRGSFHLHHPSIPQDLQGRSHLIIAIAALVYSRLISPAKWTTPMLDLIINQSHIYLVDLFRVLDKKFTDNASLGIGDLLGDFFFGVYGAKVKVWENVVPGQAKKGKSTIDSGFRDFFKANELGILEVKRTFYAVWKDSGKFYFLDPFGCDAEGFRVDPSDPDEQIRYQSAAAGLTMNSSINELMEVILENTGNTEKDPFFLHGVQVLYVKTHSSVDAPGGTVVFREKRTNRRPVPPAPPQAGSDHCVGKIDAIPRPRIGDEKTKTVESQFPQPMTNVRDFMKTEEELTVLGTDHADLQPIKFYKIVNPRRIILQGSKNCLSEEFDENSRGRQCLSIALAVISFAKVKPSGKWRSTDLDYLIAAGNRAHEDLIKWIQKGSPRLTEESGDVEDEGEDEEDEEDEEEENEEAEDEDGDRQLGRAPSHVDVSMLPPRMKFGEYDVKFSSRMSISQGDADPIVNLGEALDRYFIKYHELILENKRLMYPLWKSNGNYFVFNPYGSDDEGWRLRGHPGSLIVTDSVNELVDVLHGILEFNDRKFSLHFVHIETVGPGNKYKSPVEVETPVEDVEKYQVVFLPVTDADVAALRPEPTEDIRGGEENEELEIAEEEEEEEEDEDEEKEEENENEDEENEVEAEGEEAGETLGIPVQEAPLVDPLLEVPEQDRPDAPEQLNFFLITTNVKLEDEEIDENAREALEYERLKYNHPPPYVLPPKKVLAMLLAAKKATKSIPSLVSCFSIDSRLAVKTDLPPVDTDNVPVIESPSAESNSKLIKLPPKKYLFSRIPPIGFTPLRAINEKFIHDERVDGKMDGDCRSKKLKATTSESFYLTEVPQVLGGVRIQPSIIPLGPVIMTPTPKFKVKPCHGEKMQCRLSEVERRDFNLEKIVCYTEDILFDMIFPMLKFDERAEEEEKVKESEEVEPLELGLEEEREDTINPDENGSEIPPSEDPEEIDGDVPQDLEKVPETIGLHYVNDSLSILRGNSRLEFQEIPDHHLNASYFAAILCILGKIKTDVSEIPSTLLDEILLFSRKIHTKTGNLRYKLFRIFRNLEFMGTKFNVILKQTAYADPESFEGDELSKRLQLYLQSHATGILVFSSGSYGFWCSNGNFYLFDPHSCDKDGKRQETGTCCLLEFSTIEDLTRKIEENSGISKNEPYRIHTLCITHMEEIKPKRKPKKVPHKKCKTEELSSALERDEPEVTVSPKPSVSLIELKSWLNDHRRPMPFDVTHQTFRALNNFQAAALEVPVIVNDITRPNLPPFKRSIEPNTRIRRKPFDRKFKEHSIILEPIDLCTMAWACIRDPKEWGTRTIKGIYEASQDLAFDSLLAAEDSTVSGMIDGLLPEFEIANYRFISVLAPMHVGKLYATEGWNLSMSLKKIFDTPIYSGAVLLCERAHIGVMKRRDCLYGWWGVTGTKNLRIITSNSFEDFLKLLVMEIDEPEEVEFKMRVVTISYARKMDPDCDDLRGLHEPAITSSLPQIYRYDGEPYDIEEMFRVTVPSPGPLFIPGTVAIDHRDSIKEPSLKRCYFVAVVVLMVKRDVMQSPMASMIDKILQVADNLYREFNNPVYHTEHILRNITIMNRIFDFRDVASGLMPFTENPKTGQSNCCDLVRTEMKRHFKRHNDGILHFTNCCYGFWYSRSTDCYYYLDPYSCNSNGRRSVNGSACLCVFTNICQMVKQILSNRSVETTGFFIHRLHVESINVASYPTFQEDPMWVYLDYHWSSHHAPKVPKKKKKKRKGKIREDEEESVGSPRKGSWNNYTIEVPQLIYSIWGTLGAYDSHFGERAGRNQAAICLAVLAMQYLCHPSRWTTGILDSSVICGDSYHTESLKNSVKRGSKFSNLFNLQPCFKVFPHIWRIEYLPSVCGTLYGGGGRQPLAGVLKGALKESKNIILKCGKITLALHSSEDGFYVADPCWTGPPLFLRNRGAIYVLRCYNFNTLIYALVKMINSNQRLEFSLTPIVFEFKHEVCRSSEEKRHVEGKRIVMDAVGIRPGIARSPRLPVCGATIANDEDDYETYRKNIEIGMKYGERMEHPVAPSPMPCLERDRTRNVLVSTKWRTHRGVSKPRVRRSPLVDPRIAKQLASSSSSEESFAKILEDCDRYPRILDFTADKHVESPMKRLTRKRVVPEAPLTKPLDCLPPRKFIMKRSKKEFKRRTKEMADDVFKTWKHRVREDKSDGSEGVAGGGETDREDGEDGEDGEDEEDEGEGDDEGEAEETDG